ncbi:MAG TPA: hypothetical protein VL503_04615 [Candidatus Omnitrophota bacterium]|nr:hypothetical protein [Candidatus Omnitrophota bacterium]
MNRSRHIIVSVLAAAALGAAALGASTPAPAAKGAAKSAPAKQPAAMAGHDHHDMSKMDGAQAKGAPEKGKFTTIVGEVMDPACFLEAGSKSIGPGHFQCAVDCSRSGQTLAIYDRAADRIYFIAGELPGKNPNDPVVRYIHQKVDVSGTVYHRADAWGIVITKVVPHEGAAAPASAPGAGK